MKNIGFMSTYSMHTNTCIIYTVNYTKMNKNHVESIKIFLTRLNENSVMNLFEYFRCIRTCRSLD